MFKYNILFICLLLLNCKKEVKKVDVVEQIKTQDKAVKKEDINTLKFDDILLDRSAKKITQDWKAYNTISDAIEAIKELKFNFFIEQEDLFKTTVTELRTIVPEELDTPPIKARLLVMQNDLLRFQEELKIKKQLTKDDLVFIKAVFVSFSNLNLQINKKLEKEAQLIIKPQ